MKVVKDNHFDLRERGVCGNSELDEFFNVCELEESTIGNLRGQIKHQLITIFFVHTLLTKVRFNHTAFTLEIKTCIYV